MRIYTCAPTPPVPRPAWASAAGSRATTPPGPIRHSAIGRPMRSTNHRRSRGLLRHRSVWQHDRHYSPQGDRPELRSLSRLSKLGGPAQFGGGRFDAVSMIQSNFGDPGNLEVIARQGDRLVFAFREGLDWRGPFAM